jgi:hypothetical protein
MILAIDICKPHSLKATRDKTRTDLAGATLRGNRTEDGEDIIQVGLCLCIPYPSYSAPRTACEFQSPWETGLNRLARLLGLGRVHHILDAFPEFEALKRAWWGGYFSVVRERQGT